MKLSDLRQNPIGQAWQDVGRFREIMMVLISHGFGEIVSRMNLQDSIISRMLSSKEAQAEQELSMPERIKEVMQELGPTFIKLGQILSTRPDLIPESYIEEFKHLQSAASPLPFEVIKKQIEESLEKPLEELFTEFTEEPLASASIAQVHMARLPNGDEVVVKVLRPNIREKLLSDLSILKFLARQMENLFEDAAIFDPVGIAREFEKALAKELDFNVELKNLERAARNFSNNPDVHIPRVYREVSCENVLVMEVVQGVKVTEVTENKKEVVRRLLRAVFEMIYIHGFFHGDLHPGNILVEESGRIGLIDFGLVGSLTPRMQEYTTDLLLGLIQKDYDLVTETVYEIGIKRVPINYDLFQADVIALVDKHLAGVKMADVEFGLLIRDLLDGASRHSIAVPPDYTMMFKALITAEGVGKQLDPEMDIFGELEPYAREVIKRRYSPENLTRQGMRYAGHLSRFLQQFPITARQVLMGIENGRMRLGLDEFQFQRALRTYQGQEKRKQEIWLSGLLLFLGMFAMEKGQALLLGISFAGWLFFVPGGLLMIRLLWLLVFESNDVD